MIIPTDPRIRRLAVQAVIDHPAKSFKEIAKEFGLADKTLRTFAKAAGIVRPRGRKSWRVTKHPRDWSPLQRRIAHTAGEIADGLAKEMAMLAKGLPCEMCQHPSSRWTTNDGTTHRCVECGAVVPAPVGWKEQHESRVGEDL